MRVVCDTNTANSLSKELLNHLLEPLIVSQELIKLALVQASSSHYTAAATAAKLGHLLLKLPLHGLESSVLEQVKLCLQLLILFLELVEVGWLMGSSLEKANYVVINRLKLIVGKALVSQFWLRLIRFIHHGLEFELVLYVCPLLLEFVIVVL